MLADLSGGQVESEIKSGRLLVYIHSKDTFEENNTHKTRPSGEELKDKARSDAKDDRRLLNIQFIASISVSLRILNSS